MQNSTIAPSEVTELVSGLNRLARNIWWTWNQEAQELFHELSPRGWQNLYHNAVAILHEVSEQELRARLRDSEFAARVRDVIRRFDGYMKDQKTWGAENAPQLKKNPVAYFISARNSASMRVCRLRRAGSACSRGIIRRRRAIWTSVSWG
jgi:glucan phosphorylase